MRLFCHHRVTAPVFGLLRGNISFFPFASMRAHIPTGSRDIVCPLLKRALVVTTRRTR
ncbi:hypothetical protein [Leptospira interrogans]|uniref:hypothetical protein n=1 Tax=Leptospira interrogans TaxID=173 RepID=UPI0012B6356A|nr:hypothetical protein [Leptospira interrogans]